MLYNEEVIYKWTLRRNVGRRATSVESYPRVRQRAACDGELGAVVGQAAS